MHVMDMAEAAAYPTMSESGAQRFWNGLRDRMRTVRDALFTFNGVNMSGGSLRKTLKGLFGDAVSD